MATNKKPAKKAVAKKAPANKKKAPANKKAAPKKAVAKKVGPRPEDVARAENTNVSAVGITSTPKDNAPSVVVYANDVKNKSLRKRILAWFKN
jgi:hypothetical protein